MESHVGCYETGSLDFFGPLCVVACYVDQKDEKESRRNPAGRRSARKIAPQDRILYCIGGVRARAYRGDHAHGRVRNERQRRFH